MYELATHPSHIQLRLKSAALALAAVFPDDIPAQLLEEFLALRKRIKRKQYPSGSAFPRYTSKTAITIAEQICDFESKLDGYLRSTA